MRTPRSLLAPRRTPRGLRAPGAGRWLLLAVLVACTTLPAAAEQDTPPGPDAAFAAAAKAYEAGSYEDAAAGFRQVLAAGVENGHVLYDLGNAYLRNGELGRAIASYRRAETYRPRDQDIQANLDFARKSTKDAIAPPAPSEVFSALFFWHYRLGRGELAVLVLVLNLLFWGSLAVRSFRPRSELLRWTVVGLLVLLVLGAGSLALHRLFPSRVAVVVPQEISAHNGPADDEVVRFKLHAGTEVVVADQRDGWLRIELPDGQQGWIQSDGAEVVRF
ncbi:MAG: hypothetical protein KDD11_15270 [Acidobacteria bacterium]|nr:hypothetical protein [Acidobacteriota bacterium]